MSALDYRFIGWFLIVYSIYCILFSRSLIKSDYAVLSNSADCCWVLYIFCWSSNFCSTVYTSIFNWKISASFFFICTISVYRFALAYFCSSSVLLFFLLIGLFEGFFIASYYYYSFTFILLLFSISCFISLSIYSRQFIIGMICNLV